ncbi:MAG: DUF2182 domain-containing protein [Ktedonobacterales bacterium]
MMRVKRSAPVTTQRTAWAGSWLVAVLAWMPTVRLSRGMPPMSGTMGMPLGTFLAAWTLMMVAMMGPSLGPMLSRYLATACQRTHGPRLVVRAGVFALSYLLVWAAVGLPVFGLAWLQGYLASTVPGAALEAEAMLLATAGCYQLTPVQVHCLAACNVHLGGHPPLPSTLDSYQDVRAGACHGLDCIGACGGCMLALVAIGLMNLGWMVVFTLVVFAEKVWRSGDRLALVVGLGLLLLGILAGIEPGLMQNLASA